MKPADWKDWAVYTGAVLAITALIYGVGAGLVALYLTYP